jgi:hypothetical protein
VDRPYGRTLYVDRACGCTLRYWVGDVIRYTPRKASTSLAPLLKGLPERQDVRAAAIARPIF